MKGKVRYRHRTHFIFISFFFIYSINKFNLIQQLFHHLSKRSPRYFDLSQFNGWQISSISSNFEKPRLNNGIVHVNNRISKMFALSRGFGWSFCFTASIIHCHRATYTQWHRQFKINFFYRVLLIIWLFMSSLFSFIVIRHITNSTWHSNVNITVFYVFGTTNLHSFSSNLRSKFILFIFFRTCKKNIKLEIF